MEQMQQSDHPPVLGLGATQLTVSQKERIDGLCSGFETKYKKKPLFISRASGRVNLIGEHIDYCGYSVLPMAIEQDILMAVGINDDTEIHLSNTNADFNDFVTSITSFSIDQSKPEWHNYILCGIRGILEKADMTPKGMSILVDGNVPKSAGLSSSSALVCCAGLASMHANGLSYSKTELADICMRCEHYIGTQGGGMDQSICFLAKAGKAKHIEFNPIQAHDVDLPKGVVFVIANSCVELQKASTSHFNIRVVECRLASQLLAKSKGLEWKQMKRLADVQQALGVSLSDMEDLIDQVLHPEPYTKQELCGILGVSEDELNNGSLSPNTLHVQSFKVRNRAKHVYSEANRVLRFKALCNDGVGEETAQMLGDLMNDSHTSCRDLYECSCPELDQLVEICKQAGALGSRLTGAGWAGCTVSMVPTDALQSFLQQVKENFYDTNPSRRSKVKESLFATQSGQGALIYQL